VPCLQPSVVQSLALGKLSADEARTAEAHVRDCATCHASLTKATLAADALTHIDDTALQTVDLRGPSALIEPGSHIGSFEVLERLGEGGMGTVYTAYHPELDRKVALKLLRTGGVHTQERQARLLREAIAMARLSHPNVVAIHDVGSHEDKVFLVMERIEGETLKVWLEQGPRPWREVLQVFREAGRGLAAAHAAGMVHRDFKPGNVILSGDGRVRVTDFGLARAIGDERTPGKAESARTEASAVALSESVTQAGHTPGTVSYMAPELLFGRPADPRSDQYAFCVSLWEGLYRERPVLELLPTGPRLLGIHPAPKTPPVPAWVRRIVERGLSVDPANRFLSMEALLTALGSDPAVRWRKAYAASGVLLLLLAVGGAARLWVLRQSRLYAAAPLCDDGRALLTGVWDAPTQAAVHQALVATGKPYAEASWSNAKRWLDQDVEAWAQMRLEACRATRVEHRQSEEAMLLRMVCLERRLSDMKALVDVFLHADADIAKHAAEATSSLEPISLCSSIKRLQAVPPPPDDPAQRRRLVQLRSLLARGRALREAGKRADAVAVLRPLVTEAQAVGYVPFEAEARYWLGLSVEAKLEVEELTGAYTAAQRGRDMATATDAARMLARVQAVVGEMVDAHRWLEFARAAQGALGGDEKREADFLETQAFVKEHAADYGAALADEHKALEIYLRVLGPDSREAWRARGQAADWLTDLDRWQEALPIQEQLLMTAERAFGTDHADTNTARWDLALTQYSIGRYAEAQTLLQQELASLERIGSGQSEDAGLTLYALSGTYRRLRRPQEALAFAERADELYVKLYGRDHLNYALALEEHGLALLNAGGFREAVSKLKAALALREARDKDPSNLEPSLQGLGRAYLALGQPKLAIPLLERALPLEGGSKEPREVANVPFVLAQALWESRGDEARARRLAEEARERLTKLGFMDDIAEIDAWLAHRAPPHSR
jgi:tetratricopeptide (TPR) repeat protein/tRNA A-37 threonylcarbamoyl transferase component Bud32